MESHFDWEFGMLISSVSVWEKEVEERIEKGVSVLRGQANNQQKGFLTRW
jgi:hypothetical protein